MFRGTRRQIALLKATVGVAAVLLHSAPALAQVKTPLPRLTAAQQVRVLSPDEANRRYLVDLRGVVTYFDPAHFDLFVQDASAGIYINDPNFKGSLAPGDLVEVEGVTEQVDFAPQIAAPRFRVIGHAPFPKPQPSNYDALISTREDSQWVEFEGVVQGAIADGERIVLDVVGGGGHLQVYVLKGGPIDATRIIDAKVRVRGVCSTLFNQNGQLVGVQLDVPGSDQVEILSAGPKDPFSLPARPLKDVMAFTPQGSNEHRIRVRGTITMQRPKGLFIQDGAQGLYLPGARPEALRPGDRIDAVGFADVGDYTPVLQHAVVRRLGSGPVPAAVRVSAQQMLAGSFDAVRVLVDATLRDQRRSPADQELVLQDGDVLFEARIDKDLVPRGWPRLPLGSRLRLTGVCSVTVDRDRVPTSFAILLDSPSDLAVLARPSWWKLRNTLAALAALALVTVAVLAWVAVLRRQVRRSEARARVLFSAIPHPAYVFDVETLELLEVNDIAVEHYRYGRDEFLRMKATGLHPADDAEKVSRYLGQAGSGRDSSAEWKHRTRDGRLLDVEITFQTIDFKGRKAALTVAQDITKRKSAEEALRQNEESFRLLFSDNPLPMWVYDLNTLRFLEVNDTAVAHYGYSRAEFLEMSITDIQPADDPEPFQNPPNAARPVPEAPGSWRHRLRDGRVIDVQVASHWMRWNGADAALVVAQDVTARKRAEERLRQREADFAAAQRVARLGTWRVNIAADRISWSDGLYRIFDIDEPASGLAYEAFLTCVHPDDAPHVVESNRKARESGLRYDLDYRIVTQTGEIKNIREIGHGVKDAAGKIVGLFGTAQDITDRKRAEEALREQQILLKSIINHIPYSIFWKDRSGVFQGCNEHFVREYGLESTEAVIGRTDFDTAVTPEEAEFYTACDRQVIRSGQPLLNVEETQTRSSGVQATILTSKVPLHNGSGKVTGVLGIYADITERKRAEEALRWRTLELERSNADLEQFAYVASHDLQEPLRMVTNFTQLLALRYQGRLDRDADEFIGFAVEGATRMQALISGLLSFARVKSRAGELMPTDSEAVFSRCLESSQFAIRQADAQVTHDPLPAVLADDLQLEQVFQNLLGNALKFRGARPSRIHVSAERGESSWTFSIRDNGIGIDPAYFERIFVIFQRLHTRQDYPGAGIGLSICKRIVERHGGRIWVESAEGEGTTFRFTLPAARSLQGDERSAEVAVGAA